jgi:hypothetical protein
VYGDKRSDFEVGSTKAICDDEGLSFQRIWYSSIVAALDASGGDVWTAQRLSRNLRLV